MLYREIIAVCSQIHTKHINTLNVTDGAVTLQTITHTLCTVDYWLLFLFRNKRDRFRLCLCITQVTNALPPPSPPPPPPPPPSPSPYNYWHVFEFGGEFHTLSLCLAMNLLTQQYGLAPYIDSSTHRGLQTPSPSKNRTQIDSQVNWGCGRGLPLAC